MEHWIDTYLEKHRLDVFSFFRSAYYWCFQEALTSRTDSNNYKAHKIIPIYVGNYVRFLQQLEEQRK